MDEMLVWNVILTGLVGVTGYIAKTKFDEMDRITILLNRTREEIARDHVTRAEVNASFEKLGDRFDKAVERLELKLDDMRKKGS